jgi:tRNA A37 threonylcarbamoyladenosine synthetase subunit TsaC/SUA5/YrdC
MPKTLLEQQVDALQNKVKRLERMQPDPITIVADNDAQLVLGTQGDGSFGIRIWDSSGALRHTLVV